MASRGPIQLRGRTKLVGKHKTAVAAQKRINVTPHAYLIEGHDRASRSPSPNDNSGNGVFVDQA
jgi:hypothetical protein